MKFKCLISALCLMFGISSFADTTKDAQNDENNSSNKVTKKIENFEIITESDLIRIVAYTNITTGFDWYITEFNQDELELIPRKFLEKPSSKIVSGAGGMAEYGVRILKEGTFTFRIQYKRNWEGGEIFDDFTFTVTKDNKGVASVDNVLKNN